MPRNAKGKLEPIDIEDANVLPGGFRNFGGRKTRYNAEGKRRINLALPRELAEFMGAEGWNVRVLDPREEGDDPTFILEVEIKFGDIPPRVILINSVGRRKLEEGELEILDMLRFKKVDLTIRPYEWDVNGKQGVKAYLKTIFVTIEEEGLDAKYASIPEIQDARTTGFAPEPNDYSDNTPF